MKKQIPNILTCCNLICGCIATWAGFMSSILPGSEGNPLYGARFAFYFIILGAVFDFFDGFVARLLKVSGPLGVQLDSLADVITFGLAPAAVIFSLFTKVYYPEAMSGPMWHKLMPFTAFIIPAFAAMRLAKFNIDERQHDGFIGLPTPACAIFWAALISSCPHYLTSPHFNATFLFAFVLVFCLLMVSKIPMFKMKFTSLSFSEGENKWKFMFLIIAVVALAFGAVSGIGTGHIIRNTTRALVAVIGFYILLSIVKMYHDFYKGTE